MNHIYVVTKGEYDDYQIEMVTTKQIDAHAFAREMGNAGRGDIDAWRVETYHEGKREGGALATRTYPPHERDYDQTGDRLGAELPKYGWHLPHSPSIMHTTPLPSTPIGTPPRKESTQT